MWARFAATGSVLEFTKRRRGRRQGNDPKRVELMDLRMREKSNEEEEDSCISLFSPVFTQESECLDAASEIKQKAADWRRSSFLCSD